MKFDTLIIGGGLAGLISGISLQQAGRRTAIVSAGQNALHFFSGCFETLPSDARTRALFADAGIPLQEQPGFRLMPSGTFAPAYPSLDDVFIVPDKEIKEKVLIVNFRGYPDFFTAFLAEGLEKAGARCRIGLVDIPEMEHLRTSPSEMRSVNIARVVDGIWEKVVAEVRMLHKDEGLILLPQVFGLKDPQVPSKIRSAMPARVGFIGTMPPSVPGIRTQMQLKRRYEVLGGTFLMGDEVTSAAVHDGIVSSITTRNLDSVRLFADHFVLATGGFFSKGLAATPTRISEPLLSLDVQFDGDRNAWYEKDFFADQPYMSFGVLTDSLLHPSIGGEKVTNLYAIGSLLGRTRPDLGEGAGLAVRSAFIATDQILNAQTSAQ